MNIGHHALSSNVFLAPMAGVSDAPFRQICQQYGAGLTTSEMLISDVKQWSSVKSSSRLQHKLELNLEQAGLPEDLLTWIEAALPQQGQHDLPQSVQIVGYDPLMMQEAAIAAVKSGADIVDINMGCPAKKVCKKAAGSALLRDEPLVAAILAAVTQGLASLRSHNNQAVPVTLKIRTGWDEQQKNAGTIAKIAEDAGIAALAIHGRTRAMRFNGHAEFDTIAEVKANASIPVIANGDIDSVDKALAIAEHTKVDALMVGRAAQGQPWLIQEISQALKGEKVSQVSRQSQFATMLVHLHMLHSFYGDYLGMRIARKHIASYLQYLGFEKALSKAFNRLESIDAQWQFLFELLSVEFDIQGVKASLH